MLRKFKLEDLEGFEPQGDQCIGSEWDKNIWTRAYMMGCEIITAEDDKGVYGFCTFIPDDMGNETYCLIFNERIIYNIKEVFIGYKLMFSNRLAKRTQAFVRSDWHKAHRFAECFGFKYEGTMKSFGKAGEDYDLYAITRR